MVLGNWLYVALPGGAMDQMISRGGFQPQPSCETLIVGATLDSQMDSQMIHASIMFFHFINLK